MGKKKEIVSQLEVAAALPDVEYIRAFHLFLENYHDEQLEALLFAEDKDLHFPLVVQ